MSNTQELPYLETFKEEAKQIKVTSNFTSLGHAQNFLAQQYGFKDYNSIKVKLVEKNHKFNLLPNKINQYKLSHGGIVTNSGLWKSKDGYNTDGYHSTNSFINKIEIKKALFFIDSILEKRKTINHKDGSSYSLKHYAEKYIKHYNLFNGDYYISNGAFIVALDIREYSIKESTDSYYQTTSLNILTNYKKIGKGAIANFYDLLHTGYFD